MTCTIIIIIISVIIIIVVSIIITTIIVIIGIIIIAISIIKIIIVFIITPMFEAGRPRADPLPGQPPPEEVHQHVACGYYDIRMITCSLLSITTAS